MNNILGQFFAVLTALCWVQNSLIYAYVGKKIGSLTVTHIRLWLALPFILLIHFIFTGSIIPIGISVSSLLFLAASGFTGFFIADVFIFRSFVELGARETLVILTISPIFSAILSWVFLQEILSLPQISGIIITIAGVIWVIWEEKRGAEKLEKHQVKGITFALFGALAQAVGMFLAKGGINDGIHIVSANVIRISAGLFGLIIFAMLRKNFIQDFRKMKNRKLFLLLTSAAVIGPVLGVLLALYALSWAPVGIVTTLMQISPVILLPIDYFVFKKKITIGAAAGTVIAIGGAAILFLSN